MLDKIYKTVQAKLNKEQIGYLKPLHFNLFIYNAVRKEYDRYLTDLKSNVRKANWMLQGKNFANLSQHTKQLLEFFSDEETISKTTNFVLPENLEFVEDVFTDAGVRIEKVDYSDFKDIQINRYVTPTNCSPICSLLGTSLKVSPATIDSVDVHFLREPKTPKWTYNEVDGKAMFDPTANDFQDVDMPKNSYDELISSVFEMASVQLRQLNAAQMENQEQAQDNKDENRQ